MLVRYGIASPRVCSAMTISSSAALPARSPRPLMVHSTCRAPARTPASELATAMPRSLWQWVEKITLSAPGTFSISVAEQLVVFLGHRVADGIGNVDRRRAGADRQLDAAAEIVDRRAGRIHRAPLDIVDEVARLRHGAVMISSTSSWVLRIWCARWIGEVETKVWMRALPGVPHRRAGPIDIGRDGAREAGDHRVLAAPGDSAHRLEIAVARRSGSRPR